MKVFKHISVFNIDTKNTVLTEEKHSNDVIIHDLS